MILEVTRTDSEQDPGSQDYADMAQEIRRVVTARRGLEVEMCRVHDERRHRMARWRWDTDAEDNWFRGAVGEL